MARWWCLAAIVVCFACDDGGSVDNQRGGFDQGIGRLDARVSVDVGPPDRGADLGADGGGIDAALDATADTGAAADGMIDGGAGDMPCVGGDERACDDGCLGGVQRCNAGHWSECVTPVERCDGLDQDCDGVIDEDFAGIGDFCAVGVGACRSEAVFVCTADNASTQCAAVAGGASVEVCNAIDDDCDGQVDERTDSPCYDGPAGAAGVGVCALGTARCAGGEPDACEGAVWPGAETCDGRDEDCDGVVDEDVDALPCYAGPAGTEGVGACRGGRRICEGGAWGACLDAVEPVMEICDGVDNDCNGQLDDVADAVDCECQPGELRACYAGAPGTLGVGVCRAGQQGCGPDNQLAACQGARLPGPEVCDGADNDCDGAIDEEVAGVGGACAAGIGACRVEGARVCDAASGRLRCDAVPREPGVEICNGVDDDCDGLADDGFDLGGACVVGDGACLAVGARVCDPESGAVTCDAAAGEPAPELCDGADNDCDGTFDEGFELGTRCESGVGRCRRVGVVRCTPEGGAVCTAQAGAGQIEVCNGVDDDCDGATDEADPGGGAACIVDGVGACALGHRTCADGALICRPDAGPEAERCDGVDNDCDGVTDEADGGGLLTQACYDGAAGTVGVGPCRAGNQTCVDGEFGPCGGQVTPQPEICNQADDDCDGAVDDLAAGACICDAGTRRRCTLGPPETDGVGVCRPGEQTCLADGTGFGPCVGAVGPSVEVCNGLDDNCDGGADNVAGRGFPCQRGLGLCRRVGFRHCDPETNQLACDAEPGPPRAETCNGADDDCDGAVDELPGVGDLCAAGEGACRREANQICDPETDAALCLAVAGQPVAELCNGVDDDCDGDSDEGVPGVGVACTRGEGRCARDGETICDGFEVRCGAEPGAPAPERCDGADDDCDGRVDEDADGGACVAGQGACRSEGVQRCTPMGLQCDAMAGDPGLEVCNDVDDDCDGRADEGLFCRAFRSCQDALDQGFRVSGVYRLDPAGDGDARDVYCDQTTDGGGWTLVGSTDGQTLNDQASGWYADLRTLAPAAGHAGVWDGLRPFLAGRADMRFACRDRVGEADAPLTVDLSIYDSDWYGRITRGTDAESCFEGGAIPARRDNRTGAVRAPGQGWASEVDASVGLVGEDACGDTADFALDFDDRGADSNGDDGTDWGEDDGVQRCGRSGVGAGQWFVYAREVRDAPLARVALLGPSGLAPPLVAGGFDVTTFELDALPADLDLSDFDVVFLGRILGRWARATPQLRDALSQFSAQGGNVVTEFDGLTLLAEAHRDDMRWRAGAPQPWGWFPMSVGAGDARAVNTRVTATAPDDPTLRALTPTFSGQSGTESFYTVYPVDQGVETLLEQVATFPGLPANPQFPNDTHPAVLRGVRCGGNVIIAPFDYQDAAPLAAGQRFIQNLAATAASPAVRGLVDVCPPPRQRVMVCGRADVDVADFLPSDRDLQVVQGCAPNALVQALMITRNADAIDGPALAAYVRQGGRVITELGMSAMVYSAIFDEPVVGGVRRGLCRDNLMPAIQQTPGDRLWRQVDFEPTADTGCGDNMAGWPGITPLGGWTANTVSLARRRLGAGVVWLVEADWQDGQPSLTDASRALMGHLITGEATRGLSLPGAHRDLLLRHAEAGGFETCAIAGYDDVLPRAAIRAACDRDVLLLGCRRAGRVTLTLGGMGRRDVVLDGGQANGLRFYATPGAWGLAALGLPLQLDPCDVNADAGAERMCWHLNNDRLTPGYRCGGTLVDDASFERVILHRRGAVTTR